MKSVEEIILEIEKRLDLFESFQPKYMPYGDPPAYLELKNLLEWIKKNDSHS